MCTILTNPLVATSTLSDIIHNIQMPPISLQYSLMSAMGRETRNPPEHRVALPKFVSLLPEPSEKLATEMSQILKRCIAFFCA